MNNCITEPHPVDGGAISSTPHDAHYPDYAHYKASRWRISDFSDVVKMAAVTDAELQDKGGFYNFATGTYFRPNYFNGTARAIAGVRINAGVTATTPVDIYGKCRYLRNTSGNDIFVPFRTEKEWDGFLNNLPAGVFADKCSLPCPGDCLGLYVFGPTYARFDLGDTHNNDPQGSKSNYFAVELPYARAGTPWPSASGKAAGIHRHVFNYKCHDRFVAPKCYGYVFDNNLSTCVARGCKKAFGQCRCCDPAKTGTGCFDNEYTWQEVWQLNPNLKAGASQDSVNGLPRTVKGWSWPQGQSFSYRVSGGPRPAACENDPEHNWTEINNEYKCGPKAASSGSTGSTTPPATVCGW